MSRDHQEAKRAGVPVEVVRETRARAAEKRGPTRRRILQGAGALAATALLPRRAFAKGAPRVAIIGAGISGLSAALTLADAGIASTIYESSTTPDGIGGRMHSNTTFWADGQVTEWCGELIDSGHKTILTLAKRFNLAVDDLLGAQPNGSEDTYYLSGQYYSKTQADIDFQPVHNALQGDVQAASYPTLYNLSTAGGRALDSMSIYQWIESRVPGGHSSPLGKLLDIAYNIEYGAETTVQSALNLVYLLGYGAKPGNFTVFGKSDERFHIEGGNQRLPAAIASYLPSSTIQLDKRLVSIAQSSGGTYTLTFASTAKASSTTVTADHVILALPFAVLRTLDYRNAGFDALKNTAIQNMGRGRNGKLQLQFDDRMWYGPGPWPGGSSNGSTVSDTGYQNTWEVTRAQPGASGILVDYTGGNVAASMRTSVPFATSSTSTVVQDAQTFLSRLEPVYPGISRHWTGRATASLPWLAPNLLCSYSYWLVGQYQQFAGYEKAPQGNVYFAGEHTSVDFQGYMEGGASEGVRAGREVLAALGVHG